jgi:hypothetical protein
MELSDVSFQGPAIDDQEVLERLPADYRSLLEQINGFIQFGGGLHVRGACLSPRWHSLRSVWFGELSLHRRYATLSTEDIPFGQDALGDQFILRSGSVFHLSGGTGDIQPLHCSFLAFLAAAQADSTGYLGLEPLIQFQNEGGQLQSGQLLSAYPPFCTKEAQAGVSLKAVSAIERLAFLADFAAQVARMKEGQSLRIRTT